MNKRIDYSAIKVEKNVPIPGRSGRRKGTEKFPWGSMDVGDMFFVPCDEHNLTTTASSVATSGRLWARYNGKPYRFASRKMPGGFGIWRTE